MTPFDEDISPSPNPLIVVPALLVGAVVAGGYWLYARGKDLGADACRLVDHLLGGHR